MRTFTLMSAWAFLLVHAHVESHSNSFPGRNLLSVIDHSGQSERFLSDDIELDEVSARLADEADIARQIIALEEEEDLSDEDQLEMVSYLEELHGLIEQENLDQDPDMMSEELLLDEAEFEDDVSTTKESTRREQLLEIVRTIDAQVDSEIDDEVDDIIASASEGGGALKEFLEANNLTFSRLLNDPVGHAKNLAHFLKLANELKVVNYTVPKVFQSRFFPEEEIILLNDDPSATIVYPAKTTPSTTAPPTTELPPASPEPKSTPASSKPETTSPEENLFKILTFKISPTTVGNVFAFVMYSLFFVAVCAGIGYACKWNPCYWMAAQGRQGFGVLARPFVHCFMLCRAGWRRVNHTE